MADAIVRYAVVGLGHITQVAVLPAFAHARRNDREPEPSGVEGLRDVRIIEALLESAKTDRAAQIPAMPVGFGPDLL